MPSSVATWLLSLLLMSAGSCVAAAEPATPQLPDQASMQLSGQISVDSTGKVASYAIDKADQLPKGVIELLTEAVPTWRFKPVLRDGQPVAARATMYLRVIAKPTGDGNYSLSVGSPWFGHIDKSNRDLSWKHRQAPRYPTQAIRQRVSGTVYLIAEIGADGHVIRVATQQVNLRATGSDYQMRQWRKLLAEASIKAVTRWSFAVPTEGHEAGQVHWIRRIPIDYQLRPKATQAAYGQWISYIPGPRHTIDWLPARDATNAAADALPPGGIYAARQALQRIESPRS